MKNSLNLIIFISLLLLIISSLYLNKCENNHQNCFKINTMLIRLNKTDKFENRKYIKTSEEIELTKLPPKIDAQGCVDQKPIALFIQSVAQIEGQSYERRNILRKTWAYEARHEHRLSVYFLLGLSKNQTVNELLKLESNKHADIIQFKFNDDYRNLTLKSISMLRWAQRKCSNTRFIMKVDDDVILNIDRLLESLKGFKTGITGHRVHPKRNLKVGAPGYIPAKYYPVTNKRYPPYVYGGAYVISTDVIIRFVKAIDHYSGYYLDNEDLFLTGIIAGIAGIESHDSQEFLYPFNCDLAHLTKMSSLIALGDCLSSEQFLNFWCLWKPQSRDSSCHNYPVAIVILSWLIFLTALFGSSRNILTKITGRFLPRITLNGKNAI